MRPIITREAIIDRREPRIRWSAVLAGAFVALAIWVLLQLFDLGAALATLGANAHQLGTAPGVWSLIAPVIGMFFGGLVGGRLATSGDSGNGAMHGLVVWALTMLVSVLVTAWLVAIAWVDVRATGADSATGQMGVITLDTARAMGAALIWVGVAMLVGLIAAVLGGMAGVRRDRPGARTVVDVPVAPDGTPDTPPPPPI